MKEGGSGNVVKWIKRGVISLLLLFIFAVFTVPFVWPIEFLWALLVGWITHSVRMLRVVNWNIEAVLLSLSALIVAVVSLHFVITSLRKKGSWKWKQSVVVSTVVLLLCGMAIAFSGVIHQIAWLGREPITERRGMARATRVINNLKDIYVGLREYEFTHKKPAPSIFVMFEGVHSSYGQDEYNHLMRPIMREGDSLVYYGVSMFVAPADVMLAHTSSPVYSGGWVCLMADGRAMTIYEEAKMKGMVERTMHYLANPIPREESSEGGGSQTGSSQQEGE